MLNGTILEIMTTVFISWAVIQITVEACNEVQFLMSCFWDLGSSPVRDWKVPGQLRHVSVPCVSCLWAILCAGAWALF